MGNAEEYILTNTIEWSGIGLHTGENCRVALRPGAEGRGLRWRVKSQEKGVDQAVDLKQVNSTNRSTDLSYKDFDLRTIEHLLAAIKGANVYDAIIEIEGNEVPILDGSALPFYNLILENRKLVEGSKLEPWMAHETFEFHDELSGASYTYIPDDSFSIDVILDYKSRGIGQKHASFQGVDDFQDLAGSRTFVFANELVGLAKNGLIKGGSLENAVVIHSEETEARELEEALTILGRENVNDTVQRIKDGYQLQFDNELASHKLLDIIGDLALLGFPLRGKILARKPGHTGNIALAKHIQQRYKKDKRLRGLPRYNPNQEPIFTSEEVMGLLPHRYPFMLVDKVIELSETHVVGVKNITFNEGLFQGHFPNNPVFPGVLQMEALAQTGGILALNAKENPSDWDTYFLKMDNVKFKNMVRPGDTLILKMELLSPVRRGIVHMQGTAYVGDKIVSEGELIAQIVDRTATK